MQRLQDWCVTACALLAFGVVNVRPRTAEGLDGAWIARNVRWRAPRPLAPSEQADPRRRPSETVVLDLRLDIRQVDDSLWGRLTNLRDPEDVRWLRLLAGRRVGDSVHLAAASGPGQPSLTFEGTVEGTVEGTRADAQLTGRLHVPVPADLRPGLLHAPTGASHRQALPELPVLYRSLPVRFVRAPD